jgi:prepilin-type N-terminal cleavage/methylation domain-containing protein
MRAFSLLELLVAIIMIGVLISMTLYFRWDDTEKKLTEERTRSEATRMLWMMRIDEPMPVRGIWEWEDLNGDVWIMFREGSAVHNMGDVVLP